MFNLYNYFLKKYSYFIFIKQKNNIMNLKIFKLLLNIKDFDRDSIF